MKPQAFFVPQSLLTTQHFDLSERTQRIDLSIQTLYISTKAHRMQTHSTCKHRL